MTHLPAPDSTRVTWFEYLILGTVGFLTLAPLWAVRLTNTDDMVYSQLGGTYDWDSPYTNAVGMGRFYYLYSGYLYMAPYLIKSHWYFKLFALGPLVAIPCLLGGVLRKITGNKAISGLSILLYFVGLQFYNDYYPTSAFPFVFTVSIALFLVSLHLWLHYLEHGGRLYGCSSVALFALGILPYETFVVLFSTVTLCATVMSRRDKMPFVARMTSTLWLLRGHFVVLILYAGCYVGFAMLPVPDGFSRDHYQLEQAGFDFAGFGKTFMLMSGMSLPTTSYFYRNTHYLVQLFWDSPISFRGFPDVIRVARVDWWVRSLLSGGLVLALLKSSLPHISRSKLLALMLVGCVVFFLSPSLHALTAKYQERVSSGVYVYLPTFFSYLGLVVGGTAAIVLGCNLLATKQKTRGVWVCCCAAAVGWVSLVHSFNNFHVARYQSHFSHTWTVVEASLETPSLKALPDNCTLYAPDLPVASVTYDMLTADVRDYWSDFISARIGKPVRVVYQADKATTADYYLGLHKMPRDFEAFVVFGPIVGQLTPGQPVADSFELQTYSKYKEFQLSYEHCHPTTHTAAIEGQRDVQTDEGMLRSRVVRPVAKPLVTTRVSGKDVLLRTVDLSFFKSN